MSPAEMREMALHHAVKTNPGAPTSNVLDAAKLFLAFLNGDNEPGKDPNPSLSKSSVRQI